jgi:enamine deaminase RidA (YjgF/YER057c/UK114 family)
LFISGQVSISRDGGKYIGKLGQDYTVEEGQKAARICAINLLGAMKAAVGDLEKIGRMIKLTGFVNALPEFEDAHKVINGASDLLVEVLGEQGRHSRSAIGVGTLPLGCAVEVEAIAEIA